MISINAPSQHAVKVTTVHFSFRSQTQTQTQKEKVEALRKQGILGVSSMVNKTLTTVAFIALLNASAVEQSAAATVASNLSQGLGETNITATIVNDDNAIYNSATFDLVGTYGSVLQGIKDNNPLYDSGDTLKEIAQSVGVSIEPFPSGQVNNGWSATYDVNTGLVNLTHSPGIPNLSFDQWNSADPNNTYLALNFNFGENDFNQNGITDANELLLENGTLTNGFIGYDGAGDGGDIQQYTTAIPEPTTGSLLGLGALGLALRRKRDNTSVANKLLN